MEASGKTSLLCAFLSRYSFDIGPHNPCKRRRHLHERLAKKKVKAESENENDDDGDKDGDARECQDDTDAQVECLLAKSTSKRIVQYTSIVIDMVNHGNNSRSSLSQINTHSNSVGAASSSSSSQTNVSSLSSAKLIDGVKCKMSIFDLSGRPCDESIAQLYYRTARGVVVVFESGDSVSYRYAQSIVNDLKDATRPSKSNAVIALVANKIDLMPEDACSGDADLSDVNQRARLFAAFNDLLFVETSCVSGRGVEELFRRMAIACRDALELEGGARRLGTMCAQRCGDNPVVDAPLVLDVVARLERARRNRIDRIRSANGRAESPKPLVSRVADDDLLAIDLDAGPLSPRVPLIISAGTDDDDDDNDDDDGGMAPGKLVDMIARQYKSADKVLDDDDDEDDDDDDIDDEALLNRPTWQRDEDAEHCSCCESKFTLLRRIHHCRNCGSCVCAAHSAHSVAITRLGYYSKVRVCDHCFVLLDASKHHSNVFHS
jgi:small GTP-binding protein